MTNCNATDAMATAASAAWEKEAGATRWSRAPMRLIRATVTAALDAAPTVVIYEMYDDDLFVWACHTLDGWHVASREECETQGCENEHRTLLLGGEAP